MIVALSAIVGVLLAVLVRMIHVHCFNFFEDF